MSNLEPFPLQYVIANLGFSPNFGYIDFDKLTLPAVMSIDYVRIYQPKNAVNVGCDPVGFPTAKYIETYVLPSPIVSHVLISNFRRYEEAYTNFNLTLWDSPNYPNEWPKNRLQNDGC